MRFRFAADRIDPDAGRSEAMIVTREQYAAWQQRWDDLIQSTSLHSRDWVSPVASFLDQIVRECPDTNVIGHARDALRLSKAFKDAKRDAKPRYEGFLYSSHRLRIAIGKHLMDRP